MTIAGREAEIQNCANYGGYLIFAKGQLCHLSGEGLWVDRAPHDDEVFESREAAQAILDRFADQPTPAEPHADAGKMVAVGESRDFEMRIEPVDSWGKWVLELKINGQWIALHTDYRAVLDKMEATLHNWHPTTAETERLRGEVEQVIKHHYDKWQHWRKRCGDFENAHQQVHQQLTTLREQLAAAERERDAAKAKSQPRYYVMESMGKHWLVRDVPSWDRSLLHEDGEWSNGGAYRAVSGLKYFASKEAAEAETARVQAEAASAKGGA